MRTFIALHVDDAQRRAIDAALEPVRARPPALRWIDAAGLHVTLKFLGDTESSYVTPLTDALRDVARRHAPVVLRMSGLGAFPSLRRASVVWVGVAADPELMALQRDVETAMFSLAYPREPKPFRPHITVARVPGGRPLDVSRLTEPFGYSGECTVAALSLMRSHPGSRYETLVRAALGKGETG